MTAALVVEGPLQGEPASAACERILRALPDWFGIEEAIVNYTREAAELPTWIARAETGQPAGFLSVKQHFPCAAEVYVMGVLPEYHRAGIGSALLVRAEAWLRPQGVEYLQVKTLAPTHPDPHYARTRTFYEASGFRPLEIFPLLWGKENPCLVMVKKMESR